MTVSKKNQLLEKAQTLPDTKSIEKVIPWRIIKNKEQGGPSRWQKSQTWRSPSSPQIHQKYIYMWNNSYETPTERWQKTTDFPIGKTLPTYLAVWLTGSWCSSWVSGLSLWGGRAEFRTLDHRTRPSPMLILIGKSSPRDLCLNAKTQLNSTTSKLQCWTPHAKQLARQEHNPTH